MLSKMRNLMEQIDQIWYFGKARDSFIQIDEDLFELLFQDDYGDMGNGWRVSRLAGVDICARFMEEYNDQEH